MIQLYFKKMFCVFMSGSFPRSVMTVLLQLVMGVALVSAQTTGIPNGIDDIVGIEPTAEHVAGAYNSVCPTDGSKVFYLYNVGAKRFLSLGGDWGTHAALDLTPHALWLETENGSGNYFWINNRIAGSGTGTHLGFAPGGSSEFYLDRGGSGDLSNRAQILFEQAPDYAANNKVYYVGMKRESNSSIYYVTAYPDNEARDCNIESTKRAKESENYKNQEWKLISHDEYYKLAKANPADMESVIDFSFLMKAAGFCVNDTDMTNWAKSGDANIYFGDNVMFRNYDKRGGNGNQWGEKGNEKPNTQHQRPYGKYFYCYARNSKNFYLYQDIQVHKAGWYLLRCNGFSTQVTNANRCAGRLMMAVVQDGNLSQTLNSTATLNTLSVADAEALMGDDAQGTGAGKAFFKGQYENQVQICLDEKDLGTIDASHPVTLRVGIYVGDDCALQDGDVTAFDNFKLFYAGPRRNPELILDENQTSLLYLSKSVDTYKNSVLHLNRTFKEGKWNTLILPVDLNFGQMKRTFGDNVKVAKLDAIDGSVVKFVTVEPTEDSDPMVTAFEPYIIKPTSIMDCTGPSYTADRFHTRFMDGSKEETSNAYWLNSDCSGESQIEDDRFSLTIPANHYTIAMVTLNRDKMTKYVDLEAQVPNWISQTSFSTGAADGDWTCYGTLAKTYNDNGILEGRDKLSGDYVMLEGKLVQVPSNKQYGLKAFRCWFEVKGQGNMEASQIKLSIDGVEDDVTSIDDLNSQPGLFTSRYKNIDGVYNLDGQKVREGMSADGLPKGIYIVSGRKMVVK